MPQFNNPLFVGLGAGVVTALLYSSLATGSAVGLMLFYLAPLPTLIAGFGWGVSATLIALVAAGLLTSALINPLATLALLATVSVPAVLVTHFVFLYRLPEQPAGHVDNRSEGVAGIEWYPIGRLLLLLAFVAGTLAAIGVLMLGPSHEAYVATIEGEIDGVIERGTSAGVFKPLTQEEVLRFKNLITTILPASSAMLWLLLTIGNLWLAAVAVKFSDKLRRPSPDFTAIRLPIGASVVFLLLLTSVGLLSGTAALVISGYAAGLATIFILVGLAIAHHISRGHPLRGLFLFATYAAAFFIGWGSLVLILIGLLDPLFNLRNLPKDKSD